jgi:hypothetical protein
VSENDLQAELSTKIGNTVSELSKATTGVRQLTAATHEQNKAAATSHQLHGQVAGRFRETAEHAEKLEHSMVKGAKGLSLFGGEMGKLANHLGHTIHFGGETEGILGKIGLAAGLAGVAFEAYNRVLEATAERTKTAIEAEDAFREAMERAEDAKKKNGVAGLSDHEDRRRLLAFGGEGAVRRADYLAQGLHVDTRDVRRGMVDSFKITDPGVREWAISVATAVAKATGSFSGAMAALAGNHTLQGRLRAGIAAGNPGDAYQDVANRIYHHEKTGKWYGAATGELSEATAAVGENEYEQRAGVVTGINNRIGSLQEKGVVEGDAEAEARARLAATVSPETAELVQMNKKFDEQLQVLRRLADNSGMMGDAMNLVGDGAVNQYRRAARLGRPGDFEAPSMAGGEGK